MEATLAVLEGTPGMFDSADTYRIKKKQHRVSVTLSDGITVSGYVFVGASERLLDVLNDARHFLPVQGLDGRLVMVAKRAIVRAEPLTESPVEIASHYEGDDPYLVLGLEPGADGAAIKAAYHELMRAFHPDQVIAAGLSQAFVRLAEQRVQRINEAYRQLARAVS
jgi:hypothetical protein